MKKLQIYLMVGLCIVFALPKSIAAEWQWSVTIPSTTSAETEEHPQAFLWIPSDCRPSEGCGSGPAQYV